MTGSSPDVVSPPPLILVVDDEELIRNLVRSLLEAHGYRVLEAENGHRATELAADDLDCVDLLITDVRMPGLTGPDLARRLRADRPHLPIIFISGYVGDVLMDDHPACRKTEFLSKPFPLPSMVAAVGRLLAKDRVPA